MPGLTNPYNFEPATGKYFVGRADILARWDDRLTEGTEAWKVGKSWMLLGPGGIGKTSLLQRMGEEAQAKYKARILSLDLGYYRSLDSPEDMFADLESKLPPAKHIGTLAKKWFGLSASASTNEFVLQVAGSLLSRLSLGVAFGQLSPGISGPSSDVKRPEGITLRLVQLFNSLAVLCEEQSGPVVVFIDQMDKTYDSPRWAIIAKLFLELIYKLRGESRVIFILAMRPERKGELEYQVRQPGLFSESAYHYEFVHPMTPAEAVEAIVVRGTPYITQSLADKIVNVIDRGTGIDPYNVQLAAAGIWDFLQDVDEPHSPTELTRQDIERLVRDGHALLLEKYQGQAVQWELLKMIAQYPGGLSIAELTTRLSPDLHLTLGEAKAAMQAMVEEPSVRLITALSPGSPQARYTLAHDLLREYILSCIAKDELEVNQARRALEEGIWQYRYFQVYISDGALAIIYQYRSHLNLDLNCLHLITLSEVRLPRGRMLRWLDSYRAQIEQGLPEEDVQGLNVVSRQRYNISFAVGTDWDVYVYQSLLCIAQTMDGVRSLAVDMLAEIGEPALDTLTQLAQTANDERVRLQAAKSLGEMGKSALALDILTQLAQMAEDERVRLQAAESLGKIGEPALDILTQLAQMAEDERMRLQAAESLGKIGEPALDILTQLAQTAENDWVRLQAAKSLREIGIHVVDILPQLTWADGGAG